MNKCLKRFTFCVLFVLQIVFLSACSLTYSYINNEEDKIGYGYSKLENNCFVADISYSKGDSTDIIIPDKFNGSYVTALGGYTGSGAPTPFGVNFNGNDFFLENYEIFSVDDEDIKLYIDKNIKVEVQNVMFNITLPSKLKTIKLTLLNEVVCQEYQQGRDTVLKVFRPVYYFNISKDNKYFYTKRGKLYYKNTDKLFSDCIYKSSNYDNE